MWFTISKISKTNRSNIKNIIEIFLDLKNMNMQINVWTKYKQSERKVFYNQIFLEVLELKYK